MKSRIKYSKFNKIYLIALFLVISAVLFALSFKLRRLLVYHDELFYYDSARNIFNGKTPFIIHNINMGFEQLLYPLFIAPTFAISNIEARLMIIALINSLLVASSVFPLFLIYKKINGNLKINYILFGIIAILNPGYFFVLSITAEVLFFSMATWAFYALLINLKRPTVISSLILSVLFYLLFLTKEVALIFPLTYFVYVLIKICVLKFGQQRSDGIVKKLLISLLTLSLSYMLIFIIFKFTLFRDLSSYYLRQAYFFTSFQQFLYFIYGFFYFLSCFSMSLLLIPIFYSICRVNKCDENKRNIVYFSIIYLVIMALVVSYTITIKEDNYSLQPKPMLRYIFPLYQVYLLLFFVNINNNTYKEKFSKKEIISFAAFMLIVSLLYKGYAITGFHDSYLLVNINYIYKLLIYNNVKDATLSYILVALLNIAISLIILVICCNKNKITISNKIKPFILITPLVMCSTIIAFKRETYFYITLCKKEDVNLMLKIDSYLTQNKGDLLLIYNGQRNLSCYVDEYIDKNYQHVFTSKASDLENELINQENDYIYVSDLILTETCKFDKYKIPNKKVDYFLFRRDFDFNQIRLTRNAIHVPELSNNTYDFYINKTPDKIVFDRY